MRTGWITCQADPPCLQETVNPEQPPQAGHTHCIIKCQQGSQEHQPSIPCEGCVMQPCMGHSISYNLFPGEFSKGDRERWRKKRMLVLGFVYIPSDLSYPHISGCAPYLPLL